LGSERKVSQIAREIKTLTFIKKTSDSKTQVSFISAIDQAHMTIRAASNLHPFVLWQNKRQTNKQSYNNTCFAGSISPRSLRNAAMRWSRTLRRFSLSIHSSVISSWLSRKLHSNFQSASSKVKWEILISKSGGKRALLNEGGKCWSGSTEDASNNETPRRAHSVYQPHAIFEFSYFREYAPERVRFLSVKPFHPFPSGYSLIKCGSKIIFVRKVTSPRLNVERPGTIRWRFEVRKSFPAKRYSLENALETIAIIQSDTCLNENRITTARNMPFNESNQHAWPERTVWNEQSDRVVQTHVSVLLSLSLHIILKQASVFQKNHSLSYRVLFFSFNGSSTKYSVQESIKFVEACFVTKPVTQTQRLFRTGDFKLQSAGQIRPPKPFSSGRKDILAIMKN